MYSFDDYEALNELLGEYFNSSEKVTHIELSLAEITKPPTKALQRQLGIVGIEMEEPFLRSDLRKMSNDELLDTYNSNMFLHSLIGDARYLQDAEEAMYILKYRGKKGVLELH